MGNNGFWGKAVGFVGLLVLAATSCGPKRIYAEAEDLPVAGWHQDSLVVFQTDLKQVEKPLDVVIFIRHTTDYPYQNFWLFVQEQMANGELRSDTIECYLADNRGRWLGNGIGAIKEMPILFHTNVLMPDTGLYKIAIRQGMRSELLKGITNVGIELRKSDNGKK